MLRGGLQALTNLRPMPARALCHWQVHPCQIGLEERLGVRLNITLVFRVESLAQGKQRSPVNIELLMTFLSSLTSKFTLGPCTTVALFLSVVSQYEIPYFKALMPSCL